MKKLLSHLVAIALLAVTAPMLLAADSQTEAKVIKITGTDAQVQLANGETRALVEGESLPQGATIITGAGTEVFITPMEGTVSTVKPNSSVSLEQLSVTKDGETVTKQTALLNLNSGNLVSSLDPTKKAINNYGVRTPKGVAAAHGTVFTVNVNGTNYRVVTGTGTVTISAPGLPDVTIASGQVSVSTFNGGAATAASSLPAAEQQAVADAVTVAAAAVAVVANNPAAFNVSPAVAASELSAVVATTVAAVPAATSAVVQTAAANAPAQATAVVQTAIQTAANSGQNAGQVAAQVSSAAAAAAPTQAAQIAATATRSAPAAAAQIAASTAAVAPAQAAQIAAQVSSTVMAQDGVGASNRVATMASVAASVAKVVPAEASNIAVAVATQGVGTQSRNTTITGTIAGAVAKASGASTASVVSAVAGATGGSVSSLTFFANSSTATNAAGTAGAVTTQAPPTTTPITPVDVSVVSPSGG
ncbi:MAG: FecR domain-containing protein [Opitutaceae bacterium]|nr:FecR domain-containing protein [Opitutaceae bacterium]